MEASLTEHQFKSIVSALHKQLVKPFWPKCGLCGEPIHNKEHAKEFWLGPINSVGGSVGYVHFYDCLTSTPETKEVVPTDCDALRAFIAAAQAILDRDCPIL